MRGHEIALKEEKEKGQQEYRDLVERVKKCRAQNPTLSLANLGRRFGCKGSKIRNILLGRHPSWYIKELEKKKLEANQKKV